MKHLALRSSIVPAAILALALGGCASDVPLNQTDKNTPVPTANRDIPSGSSSVAPVQTQQPAGGSDVPAGLARVVYFDYDSYLVKDEFKPVVEGNAKLLLGAPSRKLTVEGHTDERGGSEYNLALGQKRAEAMVKSLTLLGVKADQVEAVSFGKERPAVDGHDEAAYAKNRRAELKDR
ncbi:MAG: peptidoglycan-associated lipoprotein Pal [Aquabacterium sp.]|nr:MAG: peptidoglycan-associated lipoprotein Pal [Aquabacterium sp.]